MSSKEQTGAALPHWDLSNVYPDLESEAFAQAFEDVKARIDDLDDYAATCQIDPQVPATDDATALAEVIGGYLDRANGLQRLYRTLQSFTFSFVATDSYNTTAKRLSSELETAGVRWYQQGLRFQSWLGRNADLLPQVLEQEGAAQEHAFFLQELAEQSQYLMSEAEESLAAELGLSGANAWQKLQGTVASQLKVPFEREGRVEELPITALQNLRYDPNEEVRRRAHEAEVAAWESAREPLAAAMNGVKGAVATLNRRRGRSDALHTALDQSRIDRETLDAMLGAMQEAFPVFRRYLKAKAQRLGKEALPWWDLFAPVGQAERRFTFPEASEFVVEQFGTFSERLASFAQQAFESRWIDAEPRAGKRGGAFCMALPNVEESRILCNFDGSLDQVFTLAHELGHAYHNACRVGKSMLQRITPMTLAETASTFCETIVTDAMLASAASADEELAILETFLIGSTQIIVDITSRYLFEIEVFERRAHAELSADDFCDMMLRAQAATYGEGLDERHRHPYMWAWKPHYYRPGLSFYNYPYAFGLLFGLGLYAIYQERGEAFLDQYDALLASTGEASAADLAARFGIDIRQPGFWRSSMQLIEARIARYLEL
jgi:pepF/M3 family oligoendopeptidase